MTRGRPRIPLELHKLRGTYRKERHDGRGEFNLPPCLPEPPEDFGEDEEVIWNAVGGKLRDAGILTELDAICLELLVRSAIGLRSNDDHKMKSIHSTNLRWCLSQFGLSPSSRSSLHVAPKGDSEQEADPLAEILRSVDRLGSN